jgi:hypothetical protein
LDAQWREGRMAQRKLDFCALMGKEGKRKEGRKERKKEKEVDEKTYEFVYSFTYVTYQPKNSIPVCQSADSSN